MNQKISTRLGVIIIIIIAITVGMFVWKWENNKQINKQISSQNNTYNNSKKGSKIKISDNWVLISHENFWNNPNLFANRNYKFPDIKFAYPDNWEFQCCNDMDYASMHMVYPSKDHIRSLPYIRIIDYTLSGCPNLQNSCSLDKTNKIPADEKFNQLTSKISKDSVLPKIKLDKLSTTAFVYKKTEEDNRTSKGYLINLKNDVIEIDFMNYELLEDNFIEKFLNQILPGTK